MKKISIFIILLIGITLSMLRTGIGLRASLTDVESSGEIWNRLEVFPADESLIENIVGEMKTVTDSSSAIVRVTALEPVDFMAHQNRQKVRVEKIYKNQLSDLISEKKEIYIACRSNKLFFQDAEPDSGIRSEYILCNTGFVNFMRVNQEYLVFLDEHAENIINEKTEAFLTTSTMMMPVYAYEDFSDCIIADELRPDTRSVAYSKLKDNEFFVQSEEAYNKLLEAKHDLLRSYQ